MLRHRGNNIRSRPSLHRRDIDIRGFEFTNSLNSLALHFICTRTGLRTLRVYDKIFKTVLCQTQSREQGRVFLSIELHVPIHDTFDV
jgi:hypothetical protein